MNHTHKKSSAVSIMTVIIFVTVLVAPFFLQLESNMNLGAIHAAPSFSHPLGTDDLGRDLLKRMQTLLVKTVLPLWGTVILASVIGIGAAFSDLLLKGSRRGTLPIMPMRLAALTVASIPITIGTFLACLAIGAIGALPFFVTMGVLIAVRVYLQTLELYHADAKLAYWQAHEALGGQLMSRLWRYGLCGQWQRQLSGQLLFHLQAAVVIEASLSYLGFGIQEPSPSFGNILSANLNEALKGQTLVPLWVALGLALTAALPSALFRLQNRARKSPMLRKMYHKLIFFPVKLKNPLV